MVKLPNIVLQAGWDKCLFQDGIRGGTYHLVCIWLAFRMWIPRTLRVGKVGVKVGFKQPSRAELMIQDLACLDLWLWVQDKSKPRHR